MTAERPEMPARAESDQSGKPANGWLVENVWHPFINGTGVRQIKDTITNTDYVPLSTGSEQKNLFETTTQAVASTVGAVITYVVAGKLVHSGLGTVAERNGIAGTFGSLLRNERVTNIAAAGAYEFLKKPEDGQSRFGNTAGTMLSFSAYEVGNYGLSKTLAKGTPLVSSQLGKVGIVLGGRAAIGALGGGVHYETSNLIAGLTGGEDRATGEGLLGAIGTGALMNELLPLAQGKALEGVTKPRVSQIHLLPPSPDAAVITPYNGPPEGGRQYIAPEAPTVITPYNGPPEDGCLYRAGDVPAPKAESVAEPRDYLPAALDKSIENLEEQGSSNFAKNTKAILGIRNAINTTATNASETFLNAVRLNRIVGIGEMHEPSDCSLTFFASMMDSLRNAGISHLALEMPETWQPMLDEFTQTGVIDRTKFPELCSRTLVNTDNEYTKLLDAARQANLKLRAVDYPDREVYISPEREGHMASAISRILDEDPSHKVVFLVGNGHLADWTIDEDNTQSAGRQLRRLYSFHAFNTVSENSRFRPLWALTRDIARPAAIVNAETITAAAKLGVETGSQIIPEFESTLIFPNNP